MKTLHIKEPFYTAGRLYNWSGSAIGFGVRLDLLEGEGKLKLTIGESPKTWYLDKAIARDFIKKHKSIHIAKGNRLGVVPWSLCHSEDTISQFQQSLL